MSLPIRGYDDLTVELFKRGVMLATKAEYGRALKCFNKVLSLAPAHLDDLSNAADCLVFLGRFEQAITTYDRLLAARPDDLRARSNRAGSLKSIGRLEEAMTDYDAVLRVAPNHANALFNRGNAYIDLRRPKDAIRDLRHALSLQPNDTEITQASSLPSISTRRRQPKASRQNVPGGLQV